MTPGSHATILVLEDDPGVAALERRRLERAGHTVVVAVTGDEAMFGCPAAEALGQPLTRFLPRDYEAVAAVAAGAATPLESLSVRLRSRTRGLRADGEEFPVETSVSRGEAGGRRFYTVVV